MEDRELDDLTRQIARPISRRTIFKTTLASALGGVAFLAGFRPAGAAAPSAGKCFGKPCLLSGKSSECCTGYCVFGPNGSKTCGCPPGQFECNGTCMPDQGTTICSGTCVNLSTNNDNCGGCGNVCPAGTTCQRGQCFSATCVAGAGCNLSCSQGTGIICGCVSTTEETVACVDEICTFTPCQTSANCAANEVCFIDGCCGSGSFCIPLCGTPLPAPVHGKITPWQH